MGKRIALLALGFALLGTSLGCTGDVLVDESSAKGAILPHHLFVDYAIDDFYQTLSSPNIHEIILLSPDHFGYNYTNVQVDEYNENEHGITVHLPYIDKYFPNATLHTATFKNGAPEWELDAFVDNWADHDFSKTLVLASLDFTHQEPEEIALQNDERMIDWLGSLNEDGADRSLTHVRTLATTVNDNPLDDAVALDSPEALYALIHLMQAQNFLDFTLWLRTSSASLGHLENPIDNTSHIFGTFSSAH